MGTAEKNALRRLGRGVVDVAIAAGIGYTTETSFGVVALPIISAIGKWLRGKFGLSWLPF